MAVVYACEKGTSGGPQMSCTAIKAGRGKGRGRVKANNEKQAEMNAGNSKVFTSCSACLTLYLHLFLI